jgi:hypothetical protein
MNMARGFESKSVADQQEPAFEVTRAQELHVNPERRRLELARLDVQHRLDQATTDNHKEMLRRALAALDQDLSRR